jgi:predicted cupin superfamily sugar epimerase
MPLSLVRTVLLILLAGPLFAEQPSDARSRELIALLGLAPLPGESGYFALIGRSAQSIVSADRTLAAQSQIYYLLTRDRPVNFLHWLASDDTHVLLEGGPVDYFIFHPDGRAEKLTLGRDLAAGQRLVIAIPGGCWKALRLAPGVSYALMANVLSPEWTMDRVKVGAGAEFVTRYRHAAPWTTASFLRELIGPNWIEPK